MKKLENLTIVFDMDGTIADLYSVENWLPMLRAYDVTPYIVAAPIYDMDALAAVVGILRLQGARIAITSWLSKDSTPEYDAAVRKAKREWLERYNFPFDEIHLVKYGTTKANCTRKNGGFQILVDDNESVRNGWSLGSTINANENIINELLKLLVVD